MWKDPIVEKLQSYRESPRQRPETNSTMKKTTQKKSFSSFDTKTAFQHLGLQSLLKWQITATPLPPSDFFLKHWQRLEQYFNLTSERERELLIDALCGEAISYYSHLKIWKSEVPPPRASQTM